MNISNSECKFLNLGCGGRFYPGWTNVDFRAQAPGIVEHDLRKSLPFPDGAFDVVYHSHVLEHFQRIQAERFLAECFRVLRSGGIIRVVVPDLEQICRLYLRSLEQAAQGEQGWDSNYDWMMLELLDQCVRTQSGGQMLHYLAAEQIPNESFVTARLGSFYSALRSGIQSWKAAGGEDDCFNPEDNNQHIMEFRASGEIHHWMYDRFSLARLLSKAGFSKVVIRGPSESYIPEWDKYCLDTDADGSQYKADSLYMEAIKL